MTTFWQSNNIEPKRGFRFVLSIAGRESGIKQYLVKTVKKPGFTVGDVPHQYLNHTFHFPGRVAWTAVSFTIVDTVNEDANGTIELLKILQDSGFDLPEPIGTQGRGLKSISKQKAASAIGQVYIKTLNADGIEVETWVLNNAWIQNAEFGQLDYSSEGLIDVTVTLAYDNAYVKIPGKPNVPHTAG